LFCIQVAGILAAQDRDRLLGGGGDEKQDMEQGMQEIEREADKSVK
jgi:hypothetical protein